MTSPETAALLARLVRGDATAAATVESRAATTTDPVVLAAAALLDPGQAALLERAAGCARRPRERQLVALAAAHLAGEHERVSALAREHLLDHPDSELARWIAAGARLPGRTPSPAASTTTATTEENP